MTPGMERQREPARGVQSVSRQQLVLQTLGPFGLVGVADTQTSLRQSLGWVQGAPMSPAPEEGPRGRQTLMGVVPATG